MVNALVREDPSYFTATTRIFAVIVGVLGWLFLGSIIAFVMSMCVLIVSAWRGKCSWWKALGRTSGFIGLSALLFYATQPVAYVGDKVTTPVLLYADYYSFSPCLNHQADEEERVAFLDGGRISVAEPENEGDYTFESRICQIEK